MRLEVLRAAVERLVLTFCIKILTCLLGNDQKVYRLLFATLVDNEYICTDSNLF